MPARIADVIVAVASNVLVILTHEAFADAVDSRVVEQCAECLALPDEWHDAGALRAFVLMTAVSATVLLSDIFKCFNNLFGIILEETGEVQVAESLDKG